MEVVSSKVGAGDVKLLVTIFVFVVIVSFDGVVNAAGKEGCQRTCGGGKSAIEVNYPFGFSEGCEIRLNCSKSAQRVKIGEFRVHRVTPNNIFVNVTPKCNRPLKEIEPLFGKNFGLTWNNSLLLQNCSSQAGLGGCVIPTGLIESRYRHEKCDARSDNISCYWEDKRGRKLELMNQKALDQVKCTSLFSSVAVNFDTLELKRVELSWWLDGPCNCHQDANCTTVSLLDGSMGYRCSCKDGLHGDGFAEGEGCRKACAKCKGRCEEYARGMFYCRPNRTTLIINAITLGGGALIVIIVVFCFGMCKIIKRRRELKLKKKFFKRNGGLLLQQQLSSNENSFDTTKIFTVKELEKATDNFNISGVLGQGGQGTVYKGMLMDGTIVAVKKSTLVREGQVEQFINEVVILSQINHRNIVKLLGCCLETKVPLLVYEFISNGTLSQLIRSQEDEFPLSWEMRLQIATDISGALAYLHSACSVPIYHRDIKSSNILLDDKYRAKVADFGTSRSVAIDQTHLTTIVQGTFGYLDPEFFQSSQFTDKSDVYSFGVVLVELLTGQRPIMSRAGEEEKSLVAFFISALEEDSLFDIIDERVAREGSKDEVIALAILARRCLNLNGRQRPTMKELMFEIERIRISQMPSNISKKYHLVQSISEGNQNVEDNFSSASAPFLDYTGNPSSEFHVAR